MLILGSAGCLIPVAGAAGLGGVYVGIVAAAVVVVVGACIRLLIRPSRSAANLRPFVECYALVVTLGFVAALAAHQGIAVLNG
jgi:hypothetical protein